MCSFGTVHSHSYSLNNTRESFLGKISPELPMTFHWIFQKGNIPIQFYPILEEYPVVARDQFRSNHFTCLLHSSKALPSGSRPALASIWGRQSAIVGVTGSCTNQSYPGDDYQPIKPSSSPLGDSQIWGCPVAMVRVTGLCANQSCPGNDYWHRSPKEGFGARMCYLIWRHRYYNGFWKSDGGSL